MTLTPILDQVVYRDFGAVADMRHRIPALRAFFPDVDRLDYSYTLFHEVMLEMRHRRDR